MVEKFWEPLSAYAAAVALGENSDRIFVLSVRTGDWRFVYPTCALESMDAIVDAAQASTSFVAFTRHRPKPHWAWGAAEVEKHGLQYECEVCHRTLGSHP